MVTRKQAKEVGRAGHQWYVQDLCVQCGFIRWVQEAAMLYRQKQCTNTGLCRPCASRKTAIATVKRGADNHNWKGGRSLCSDGYIRVKLYSADPLWLMANKSGYVREHRYVMAQSIGRTLESWEIVHHKNSQRDDNRLENLELLKDMTHHVPSMALEQRIKTLEARVTLLEAENIVLRGSTELIQGENNGHRP